jgi:hypothetical protein
MLAILRGKTHAKENEIDQLKAQIAALEAANATLKARIEELTSPPGKASILANLRSSAKFSKNCPVRKRKLAKFIGVVVTDSKNTRLKITITNRH